MKDKVSGSEPKHDGERFNAAQNQIFVDSFQLDQSRSIVALDTPFEELSLSLLFLDVFSFDFYTVFV